MAPTSPSPTGGLQFSHAVIQSTEGGGGRGPQDRRRLALITHRPSRTAGGPSAAPRPSPVGQRSRGGAVAPTERIRLKLGDGQAYFSKPPSPRVADATPHPHPCLKRRSLFIERAPWAGPPRRPPRGPPHYADVAEIGHFMPLPHLLRLADARVSTSRPKPHQPTRWYRRLDTPQCCLKASPPIATRLRRGGSPTSRPPPSPASHWTGMPRQPSHDAQRRVPLHIDARRARSLPSRPRLTRPSTLTTLMPPPPPTPGCRLKDRHPYSRSRIAAPPLRAGARATGRVCMLRRGQAPCQAMPSEAPVPARRHDPTLSATTLAPWWTGPLRGRPRGRYAALVVGRGRLTHESPPPKGRDK